MRRFAALAWSTLVVAAPTPAFAQDSGAASSSPGSTLVLAAAIAGGLAVFLMVIVLFGSMKLRSEAAVGARLATYGLTPGRSLGLFGRFRFLRRAASSAEAVARERGAVTKIEGALETADLPLKAGEAIIGIIALAVMAGVVALAVTQNLLWGVVVAALIVMGALVFVNRVAAKARKQFEDQLPDTLNMIATSLRAGYSLLQAVEAVGQEASEPTRREFGRAMAEIRLGKDMDDALQGIVVRMGSQDFDWTVMAINIQREVGGNLAEVLQTTAETMMHRTRLRGEMKALTAEGRISGIVIGILPIALFIFISMSNPDYLKPLLESTIGVAVLVGGGVFMLIGFWWMQKIIKVDF